MHKAVLNTASTTNYLNSKRTHYTTATRTPSPAHYFRTFIKHSNATIDLNISYIAFMSRAVAIFISFHWATSSHTDITSVFETAVNIYFYFVFVTQKQHTSNMKLPFREEIQKQILPTEIRNHILKKINEAKVYRQYRLDKHEYLISKMKC